MACDNQTKRGIKKVIDFEIFVMTKSKEDLRGTLNFL